MNYLRKKWHHLVQFIVGFIERPPTYIFESWKLRIDNFIIIIAFSLLFLLLVPFFSRLYLANNIRTDIEQLTLSYQSQLMNYQSKLQDLSQLFLFECDRRDLRQLESTAYYDYQVRRIILDANNGKKCSSYQDGTNEVQLHQLFPQLSENVGLWFTQDQINNDNLLVGEWRDFRGSMKVFFEPILMEGLKQKYCHDCLLTVISSPYTMKNTQDYYRGNIQLLKEGSIVTIELLDNLFLDVYPSPSLIAKYQNKLQLPLSLLGFFCGLVFILLFRLRQKQKMSLHALVNQALLKKEFIPFYQPIVNVFDHSLYGCEMLARWQRPNQDLISPMEFIPYVEKSGQILPITEQLMARTIDELSHLEWYQPHPIISINVVPDHLETQEVIINAMAMLEDSSLQPSQIAFEVTERKRFTDLVLASEVIEQLRAKGIDVKLDNAGTGYGGFSYIQELNIRSLKIDKMFIDNIGTGDIKLSLLNSIIAFGKEAGMEMIAEGVETQAQSHYLAEHGVYLQQGYFFGKPMPFEDFSRFCQRFSKIPKTSIYMS